MASLSGARIPARSKAGPAKQGRGARARLRTLGPPTLLMVLLQTVLPAAPLSPGGWGAGDLHAQERSSAFRADASLRPGYHEAWRTDRDGSSSEVHDFRMRVQLGGWWTPDPEWAVRARVAGRLSTEQEAFSFHLHDHVPAADGLPHGELTLDEAYLRWRPGDRLQLRAGRMQTSFELAGVARKSLDRNDSPNTDVTWTDGLHATVRLREGWRQHLILQRNGSRGPSNAIRGPLDVTGPASRVMVFGAMQFDDRLGPLIQREIALTYLPGVVPPAAGDGARGDYLALVLRGAAQPGVTLLGGRLVLGTEAGVASGAPSRALLRTGTSAEERGDAWAFQLSASLMEMGGRHSLGVVHSQAGDGWLISPDVRDNNREVEARYYWQYSPWGRLDVRFRYREEMHMRVGSLDRRRDRDVYVRTTLRF